MHNTIYYYKGIVSFMGSGIQVWWWPEKWTETSHLCSKLCYAWWNSFGYIYWSQHNGIVSSKDTKLLPPSSTCLAFHLRWQ